MKTAVVVPVYGNWPIVRLALSAVQPELGPDRELIVVDDVSPDETADHVERTFPDAKMLRNSSNEGFGPACNRGAAASSAEYVCFLNSDAIVSPGALNTLERALETDERIGAAVAPLLDEHGLLQEAGWVLGGDGVPYALGRGSRVDDARWAFRREVDYGSAACLVVRAENFRELGGFDDEFAPGYYEDADLCVRLAEHGLDTVVEPEAHIVHLQHGSGSLSRAKSLVRRNRARFLARWAGRFARRPFVTVGDPPPYRQLALRDAITLSRFLVVRDVDLAREVATRWRHARVTLLDVSAENPGDGIEVAVPTDPAAWLENRRFHYSAMLGDYEHLRPALRRSQPQAFEGPAELREDLVEALAAGGIAPPGAEPRG